MMMRWRQWLARSWLLSVCYYWLRGMSIEGRPHDEAWGVLYRITRSALVHLDSTEGVPGRRYRHMWLDVEDVAGAPLRAVTYVADGNELDGNPSLRYITLIRDGARAHGLPEPYLEFLERVKHAHEDNGGAL
ncbi:MAG: gamma-glutamylcyclotransferase [Ramlibacter sp.]|nr:gamma-glutamylcyclotransferase [Ramlibacter sp.]